MRTPPESPCTDPPRVWLLCGPKTGDNAQLEAIADALTTLRPVRVETRRLAFHAAELLVTLLQTPSRLGLRAGSGAGLAPPWPDLVLSAGRRNEPVARWIQRMSRGRTRLVHVGRPWADPRRYDLVLCTPQYQLDADTPGRVRMLPLPPVPSVTRRAAETGFLALLIGGDSGSQQLTASAATTLARTALALAREQGLALRVTTSARTPRAAAAALAAVLLAEPDVELFLWHDPAGRANPYRDWLAGAAAFVVTADSISMVTEASTCGVPLWIAPLPASTRPWWLTARGWRWKSMTHELAQLLAPRRFRRDARRLLDGLVRDGRAAWLGDARRPMTRTQASTAHQAALAVNDLLGGAPEAAREAQDRSGRSSGGDA